jgi:hypothetical protein
VALGTTAHDAVALEFNGYLQAAVAMRTQSSNDQMIYQRQLVNTKIRQDFYDLGEVVFEADFWRDDADYQSDGAEMKGRVREGYLKLYFPDADLRIGRFQIAWGQADGIIISDQVSPFDLENFIIPAFDEIRLGVDGATLDYFLPTGQELQVTWIARFKSPDYPSDDSPWRFIRDDQIADIEDGLSDFYMAPVNIELGERDKPAGQFKNSEAAIRLRGFETWADWSVGYLYSWDDQPNLRIRQGTPDGMGEFDVPANLKHNRYHMFMASAAAPLGPVLLKSDNVFEHNRYFSAFNQSTADDGFVDQLDMFRTLLAGDFKPRVPGWSQPDASIQLIYEKVIDAPSGLAREEESWLASLRLQAAYRNETIKPWILLIGGLRGDNTWLQTKVDYEPFDNWRFTLEADFFWGHAYDGHNGGVYGGFERNHLIGTSVRWFF